MRTAVAVVEVTKAFARDGGIGVAQHHIAEQLEEVRGPRGGRYVGVGPIAYDHSSEVWEAFMRNTIHVRGQRAVKYVRPKR